MVLLRISGSLGLLKFFTHFRTTSSNLLFLVASLLIWQKPPEEEVCFSSSICSLALPAGQQFLLVLPSAVKIEHFCRYTRSPKWWKHWTIAASLLCSHCSGPGTPSVWEHISALFGWLMSSSGSFWFSFCRWILCVIAVHFLIIFYVVLCVPAYLRGFLRTRSFSSAFLSLRKCLTSYHQFQFQFVLEPAWEECVQYLSLLFHFRLPKRAAFPEGWWLF